MQTTTKNQRLLKEGNINIALENSPKDKRLRGKLNININMNLSQLKEKKSKLLTKNKQPTNMAQEKFLMATKNQSHHLIVSAQK